MVAAAQVELKHLLDARTRMAEAKISQAEKQAVDEVRGHVIDITISAAKALILENIQEMPGDELIKRAIADIERKVH
jgi:F-type H+-transporting ATPase subunit b